MAGPGSAMYPQPIITPDSGSGSGSDAPPPPPSSSCGCLSGTLRVMNLCHAHGTASSSSPSSSLLADTLAMEHGLMGHWETLNGCPNAQAHMDTQTLRCMTEGVGLVIQGHETAVEGLSWTWTQERRPSQQLQHQGPQVFIGRLQLDRTEAAIVAQEALKHSLIRLGAMLQDIKEEVALQDDFDNSGKVREKEVRDLGSCVFRLLARVDALHTG